MPFTKDNAREAQAASIAAKAANKSGDSKLADAQEAKLHDRETPHMDVGEHLESLKDQLQGAGEALRAAGQPERAAVAEERFDRLVRLFEGLEKRITQMETGASDSKVISNTRRGGVSLLSCSVCRQSMFDTALKRGVCKGNHVTVRVAPDDQDLWRYFQGVYWNGVRYAGVCLLPPEIADGVRAQISRWAQAEKRKLMGRGRVVSLDQMTRAGIF